MESKPLRKLLTDHGHTVVILTLFSCVFLWALVELGTMCPAVRDQMILSTF